ncbi:TIGR01212 family radical SAM protein [Porcipelethomonas sp.]|uniref:TIGR01212 family radical SAM protein n=1 Tax=Porcipelethomonas sp. TaxID=2981675 RepID=UPI003EF354D5
MFKYTCDNKRYHTLAYHNKKMFRQKVYKAVIDAGFSCPNKDGSKGFGGCIFCDSGSGYFTASPEISVKSQLDSELKRIHQKYPEASAIAYFQANTNTYSDAYTLKKIYDPVIDYPGIIGISIGTRADCLPSDILDYLEELSHKTYLTVELGMQTVHEKTLTFINRGYSHDIFLKGYSELKKRNIRTCIHIINGLPGESEDMMLETAIQAGKLEPDALKIQLLHVISGTPLAKLYNDGMFPAMSKEQYINLTVKQLEYIPQETVIERITGDGDKRKLIAPLWSSDKISVLGGIDKRQAELDSWQGKKYKKI